MFHDLISIYNSYWRDDPTFDSTNSQTAAPHLPCPLIDPACLARLLAFAAKDNWGRRRKTRNKGSVDS